MQPKPRPPFLPWIFAACLSGLLVWPSVMASSQAFSWIGTDALTSALTEFVITVIETVVPYALMWFVCWLLVPLVRIWCIRISTHIMLALLITVSVIILYRNNNFQSFCCDQSYWFFQLFAFLPATIFGGILGGLVLFFLRRLKARRLSTFAFGGFIGGLLPTSLGTLYSISKANSVEEMIEGGVESLAFWSVGGLLALSMIWFWWQTLVVLRSKQEPDIG